MVDCSASDDFNASQKSLQELMEDCSASDDCIVSQMHAAAVSSDEGVVAAAAFFATNLWPTSPVASAAACRGSVSPNSHSRDSALSIVSAAASSTARGYPEAVAVRTAAVAGEVPPRGLPMVVQTCTNYSCSDVLPLDAGAGARALVSEASPLLADALVPPAESVDDFAGTTALAVCSVAPQSIAVATSDVAVSVVCEASMARSEAAFRTMVAMLALHYGACYDAAEVVATARRTFPKCATASASSALGVSISSGKVEVVGAGADDDSTGGADQQHQQQQQQQQEALAVRDAGQEADATDVFCVDAAEHVLPPDGTMTAVQKEADESLSEAGVERETAKWLISSSVDGGSEVLSPVSLHSDKVGTSATRATELLEQPTFDGSATPSDSTTDSGASRQAVSDGSCRSPSALLTSWGEEGISTQLTEKESQDDKTPSPDLVTAGTTLLADWSRVDAKVAAEPSFAAKVSAERQRFELEALCIESVGISVSCWPANILSLADAALQAPKGISATLHVYDVGRNQAVQVLNSVLAHKWAPLKFGGVFHVGVEILGKEWAFGAAPWGTGVSFAPPKCNTEHTWRESVTMLATQLSEVEVAAVLRSLSTDFMGSTYHLLNRNCCHFAQEFCKRLGVGEVPQWLFRLALVGSGAISGISVLEDQVGKLQLSRSLLTLPLQLQLPQYPTTTGACSPVGNPHVDEVVRSESRPNDPL